MKMEMVSSSLPHPACDLQLGRGRYWSGRSTGSIYRRSPCFESRSRDGEADRVHPVGGTRAL